MSSYIDDYSVTFENGKISCIINIISSSIGTNRIFASKGNIIFYDLTNNSTVSFNDLFEYPDAAKNIISSVIIKKVMNAVECYNKNKDYKSSFHSISNNQLFNILNFDTNNIYIVDNGFAFDFIDRYEDKLLFSLFWENCLERPIVIPFHELKGAGLSKK